MTLGQQLTHFRKYGRYTRPEISDSTGLNITTLMHIENGITRNPKISTTKILQDYMDSTILTKDSLIQIALDDIIEKTGSIKKASEAIGCCSRAIYRWKKGTIPHPAIRKIILKLSKKKISPK